MAQINDLPGLVSKCRSDEKAHRLNFFVPVCFAGKEYAAVAFSETDAFIPLSFYP